MMRERVRRTFGALWARRWLRRTILVGLGAVVAVVVGVVGLNVWMVRSVEVHRYADVERVPDRPVAIVLGAGVFGNEPSPTLATRLEAPSSCSGPARSSTC